MKLKDLSFKDIRLTIIVSLFIMAALNAFMFGINKFVDAPYFLFSILVPVIFAVYVGIVDKKEVIFALAAMIISIFWFVGLGFSLPMEEFSFMTIFSYVWKAIQGFVMLIVGIYIMPKVK